MLVILSEVLPRSGNEAEVSVDLLSSDIKDAVTLNTVDPGNIESFQGDGAAPTSTDPFLEGIVDHESKTAPSQPFTVYHNKHSGHLYWAVWLKAGESLTIPFKYKITWPEGHQLII